MGINGVGAEFLSPPSCTHNLPLVWNFAWRPRSAKQQDDLTLIVVDML